MEVVLDEVKTTDEIIVDQEEPETKVSEDKTLEHEVQEEVLESKEETESSIDSKKPSVETKRETEEEKVAGLVQRAAEKPVTGYASEEEYKAALAEKRRQAREAKERELELERQRKVSFCEVTRWLI